MTTWVPVPNYEGYYSISSDGELRREPAGTPVHPVRSRRNSYYYVSLYDQSHLAKGFRFHVLVALAFLGPCPSGHQVNHIDGVKAHNGIRNLEYLTAYENHHHAARLGLLHPAGPKGIRNPKAKLTEDEVRYVRESSETHRALGARFGMNHSTIGDIKRGYTWRSLE